MTNLTSKYLEKYKYQGTTVMVKLKDFPMSHIAGDKVSKEILFELGYTPKILIDPKPDLLEYTWIIN